MKLSAPVYHLKRKAKRLAGEQKLPLHDALDRVARDEGYARWSLLAQKASATAPARKLFAHLTPGDLVLLGARPGHGKTLMSLELAVEAMKTGHRGVFYTLEYTQKDIVDRFRDIGVEWAQFEGQFTFDCSDAISADYIVETLATAARGTLVVIDYLQLLDQKRQHPALAVQVRALKAFARERGLIIVFISQIDRSFDPASKHHPDRGDVRLPNPLDLALFNKACFLHDGQVRLQASP